MSKLPSKPYTTVVSLEERAVRGARVGPGEISSWNELRWNGDGGWTSLSLVCNVILQRGLGTKLEFPRVINALRTRLH